MFLLVNLNDEFLKMLKFFKIRILILLGVILWFIGIAYYFKNNEFEPVVL